MTGAGGMLSGGGENGEGLLILGAREVGGLLAGGERDLLAAVESAYRAHGRGQSSLPHSTFLRFPGDDANRIIGLPAYLGDGFEAAGMKWIASYPANVARGLPRASAVVVLNSTTTGRPLALLEGSIISARRTAASAALAARHLAAGAPEAVGLVGAGPINRETLRFLRVVFPEIEKVVVFDLDPERARTFGEGARRELGALAVETAPSIDRLLAGCPLVSFATSAVHSHVDALDACPPGAVVLHVSLRDLAPEAILAADNVVDDPDHVCRAETSVHRAERKAGSRAFIRCTLAQVLDGEAPPKPDPDAVTVFSPFGLGVLDLAVASLVLQRARARGVGAVIEGFLPETGEADR